MRRSIVGRAAASPSTSIDAVAMLLCIFHSRLGLWPPTLFASDGTTIYSWRPRSGETFAVMASTPARAWPVFRTYDERSNVALIQWP